MKILVTGAAGMIGRKFCEALAQARKHRKQIGDPVDDGRCHHSHAPAGAPFEVNALSADITDSRAAESFIADRPEMIYHLAAVVSGEAESDLEKGYRVNLSGTQQLFEAVRQVWISTTSNIRQFNRGVWHALSRDRFPRISR